VHYSSCGAPSFAFSPSHLGVQGIQPLLPQRPVPAQPLIDLGQRRGAKTVDTPSVLGSGISWTAIVASLDPGGVPSQLQVPSGRWVAWVRLDPAT
jgi:hypothetical protein